MNTPPPLPLTTASEENCPPENCLLTIIASTQANSPKRVLRVQWVKTCVVYEYYNIRVLQLRSKNRFTSIYFLQILTKPCRKPLIRKHFSLNASWFSFAKTQKKKKLWKIDSEKISKNFIVNNNNRIIRAWYLREVHEEHTYLPKMTGIFPVKIIRN